MKTDLLFSSHPFISCEKVTLTRITDMDIPALWEIMGNEDNYRFSPTGAMQSVHEVTSRFRKAESLFREKKSIFLGIFANDDVNKLVGTFEISDVNPRIEAVSINFMLGREYTGKGYATTAVSSAVKYLFERVEVNRIQALVLPINYSCKQLLERCGFVKEGTIRDGFLWPDKGIVDLTLYSILPSDYKKHQQQAESKLYKF